ncbi:MAG: protein kinase domain-containing protein [Gammaproteobacteria bacterium]
MSTAKSKPVLPERIGRYAVRRLLGRGGQGVVLLGHDSELDRQVAIKLLKPDPEREQDTLVNEARIVSRLQHPNIVTLHDVGSHGPLPYIVFEFIDGQSLKDWIGERSGPELGECVILMSQILGGVAYLHENGIVHRDLSPANILITRDGTPKVTDFGISVLHQQQGEHETQQGTLPYMAPEPLMGSAYTPASDVFTLASVFYEMLTGKQRFKPGDMTQTIHDIVHAGPIDTDALGIELPGPVADVLRRSGTGKQANRYRDARAMKNALDAFRLPRGDAPGSQEDHSTVQFMLRRMQNAPGFSSLSQHFSEILDLTADDSVAPAERIVNIVAKDVTLSQRVLTLANSAYYGNAEISSLARAVVLLGMEQVRSCLTSALLNQQFESGSPQLQAGLVRAFHSAILAKSIAPAFEVDSRSEAFSAAMFHDLGRLLTIHYFPDEHGLICQRAADKHSDELTESREVLGIAYHELGAGVATHWRFPEGMINAMRPLPRAALEKAPEDEATRLQVLAAFANAVSCAIDEHEERTHCHAELAIIAQRVAVATSLGPEQFDAALGEAATLTAQYARLMKIDPEAIPGVGRMVEFTALSGEAA